MKERLPFKWVKKDKMAHSSVVADVYEFLGERGGAFVYKEIRPDSELLRLVPGSLEEKAWRLKKIYEIVRDYYGDEVVETLYFIGQGKDGEAKIMLIQPKIEGRRASEMTEFESFMSGADDKIRNYLKIWYEGVLKDQRWDKIGMPERRYFKTADFGAGANVIVTKEGQFRIVDW